MKDIDVGSHPDETRFRRMRRKYERTTITGIEVDRSLAAREHGKYKAHSQSPQPSPRLNKTSRRADR